MPMKIRVGVIFGGRSGEHDVSLRSAEAIINAVDRDQFEVVPIGIARDGRWITGGNPLLELADCSQLPLADPESRDLAEVTAIPARQESLSLDVRSSRWAQDVDVLFPVLHGPWGEDGTVQGMLELANVPYVGAGVLASAVGMDKITSKQLFERLGLPVAPWTSVLRRDWRRDPDAVAEKIEREIGYPCFTKPANLGSSVGIDKVHHAGELAAAMDEAARHDRKILIELGLDARELEVSVLGNDDPVTSVVGEIIPANEFYDFEAKYVDDRSELLIPAAIDASLSEEIRALAIGAFKAIDGAGMARVDFFLERATNHVYLNEINTIPGFTQASMYPRLWAASGLSFRDLVTRLVELAIERHSERQGWPG
ncbi:MAG TPA: D-alanine--D-alanine ligase family protein [Nitrolancea sp.]|nr:D-alanine--D-alanine ligase family protein [Nitrolancea sp.]